MCCGLRLGFQGRSRRLVKASAFNGTTQGPSSPSLTARAAGRRGAKRVFVCGLPVGGMPLSSKGRGRWGRAPQSDSLTLQRSGQDIKAQWEQLNWKILDNIAASKHEPSHHTLLWSPSWFRVPEAVPTYPVAVSVNNADAVELGCGELLSPGRLGAGIVIRGLKEGGRRESMRCPVKATLDTFVAPSHCPAPTRAPSPLDDE